MRSQTVAITNLSGLHARPAARVVEAANRYKSQIAIFRTDGTGKRADAKSIFTLLSLGISKDTSVTIEASGVDEAEALQALADLIVSFKE